MKKLVFITLISFLSGITMLSAQFNRNPNRFGRPSGSTLPQSQTPPPEPEAKTADELVDEQLPKIVETVGLDPFEEAIMRATLVKYVQKRLELQILKLEREKMKEEFQKLSELQHEELKASLPPEKFEAYLELEKNRFQTKRKKKKKKKKNKE